MKSLKQTIMESAKRHYSRSELVDYWDKCVEYLGQQEMLDALFQAMSTDEVEDMLEFFERNYDINIFNEDEDEDEDEDDE